MDMLMLKVRGRDGSPAVIEMEVENVKAIVAAFTTATPEICAASPAAVPPPDTEGPTGDTSAAAAAAGADETAHRAATHHSKRNDEITQEETDAKQASIKADERKEQVPLPVG
jgi:hypothetical protein